MQRRAPEKEIGMNMQVIKRGVVLAAALLFVLLTNTAVCAGIAGDVEKILRDIPQDRPLAKPGYLKRTKSINADSAYYKGFFNGIEVAVETHPNSTLVASVLLKIPGPDQTSKILPAVTSILGSPHYTDKKKSDYSWQWPKYRAASLHYVGNGGPNDRFTIVSLYYQ
jgi:hypothetical protein